MQVVFPAKPAKFGINVWEEAIAQNSCVHEVPALYRQTGESRMGAGMVQDLTKIWKGKSYMCIWIFFFLSSPALFESPRTDQIYCLCNVPRSRKGMHRL